MKNNLADNRCLFKMLFRRLLRERGSGLLKTFLIINLFQIIGVWGGAQRPTPFLRKSF